MVNGRRRTRPAEMEGVGDPSRPRAAGCGRRAPPEKGVDWGDVATEGARFVRSGAFNTILRPSSACSGGRRPQKGVTPALHSVPWPDPLSSAVCTRPMAGPALPKEVAHARVHRQGPRTSQGQLADLADASGSKGINITGIAGSTWQDSGAITIITNDDAGTRSLLDSRGTEFRELDLVAASLEDKPGTLGDGREEAERKPASTSRPSCPPAWRAARSPSRSRSRTQVRRKRGARRSRGRWSDGPLTRGFGSRSRSHRLARHVGHVGDEAPQAQRGQVLACAPGR